MLDAAPNENCGPSTKSFTGIKLELKLLIDAVVIIPTPLTVLVSIAAVSMFAVPSMCKSFHSLSTEPKS